VKDEGRKRKKGLDIFGDGGEIYFSKKRREG
jgi:hypothetical protein